MSIKYIIVDDEYVAHDIISKYCSLLPNMQLMQNCYDAIEAIEYLNDHTVDLIFLDLNMPKIKGFEFLKTLPNQPKVIVTTAYKEYALEGYELNIVDYLLKPFSFDRFLKAINKAFINTSKIPTTAPQEKHNEKPEKVFLRTNNKHIQVDIDDILFAEASGNYIRIVLKEDILSIRGNLLALNELIPTDNFIQVHRSFMVVQKYIKSIEGNQILIDKYTIPIGKSFKSQIDTILKQD
ncbi:response regulator transcription factor [Chryseobacterium capnotolerans]|uniref:LytR/AlgR family response regulator transcription factor n=1 Tax=Chryseobacterium TaxID=59732 RepID=UPI00083ABCAB|nr:MULTISPECIES: response regulator transcription factor [Chryseobacterium]UHO39706.1 response regulator transcription factor [Chryseobacterium capnotolerans]